MVLLILSSFLIVASFSLFTKTFAQDEVNINLGGGSVGRFISDSNSKIELFGNTKVGDWHDSSKISGAEDKNRVALGTHRYSQDNWGFEVKRLSQGQYECTMHFAETSSYFSEPSKRIFNAGINGDFKYNIDVFKGSGKFNSYTKTFRGINVPWDGQNSMKISMIKVSGDPFLSALTCIRVGKNDDPEQDLSGDINSDAGGNEFSSSNGGININLGGNSVGRFDGDGSQRISFRGNPQNSWINSENISGAEEKNRVALGTHKFSSQNWGFRVLNVPPGKYECTLHFSETSPYYFESEKRVFNARINNKFTQGIDVFKFAGNYNSYTRTLYNIEVPWNGINDLNVSLEKIKGDPFLSALTCVNTEISSINLAKPSNTPNPSVKAEVSENQEVTPTTEQESAANQRDFCEIASSFKILT